MNIHIKSILSAIAFSLLFYGKSFGLNLVLISILTVVLLTTLKRENRVSWWYSSLYILTAILVFLNPSGFTIFVHFMTLIVFIGKSISSKSSLYISWFIGTLNLLFSSLIRLSENKSKEKSHSKKTSTKTINYITGGTIAVFLIGVFSLLYKDANPVFGNLIAQIDLSFISIPWLLFTFLGYLLFLHLLQPFNAAELIDFDAKRGNSLEKPVELVLIQNKKKLEREHTIGSMVFGALNLLLLFFLITDVLYLLQETDLTNADYSKSVHQGIYALVFSIVCAIALILYFFRGNLNFYENNKQIKKLTFLWVILNTILVLFTAYKNYSYIEALGLTYKRIGVLVYLVLTLTGLVIAFIKVAQIKNFIFLVRTNIAAVFAFLIISAAIPWDKIITSYNLAAIKNTDIEYLINLGDSNSLQLYHYVKKNRAQVATPLSTAIIEKYHSYKTKQVEKTWQEYTLYHVLNTHKNDHTF